MSSKIVAIGALGGSGTRAVAEVFIQAGIFPKVDLNLSNDNLIFTRLFKNPRWYQQAQPASMHKRMDIFKKYMSGTVIEYEEVEEMRHAAETNDCHPSEDDFFESLNQINSGRDKRSIWGWKEPNTQIFIKELLDYFPALKYIHVLRHGVDMAFSKNKNQLKNWGWKFGIHLQENETSYTLAQKQLEYWIRSTEYVMRITQEYNDRILILNYSHFYTHPKREIDRLIAFCNLNIPNHLREALYTIPKDMGSNHRFTAEDLDLFSKDQLEYVGAMGFSIPA